MKIKVLVATILCFNVFLAQEIKEKNIKLKTFCNSEFINNYSNSYLDTYLSFALEINNLEKENFNELELLRLRINSNLRWDKNLSELDFHLGYNYNFRILKKSEKLKLFIGVGAEPYFYKTSKVPLVSTDYKYVGSDLGMDITIIPRCQFRLNKRIGIEAKVNIGTMNFNKSTEINKNPIIPIGLRKHVSYDFLLGFVDRSYVRASFGINYNI